MKASEIMTRDVVTVRPATPVREAVALLADRTGVARVGTLGARFGGLVAALTAERESLPLLALWEPVTQGAAYMRELLRTQAAADLIREDDAAEPPAPPSADDAGAASGAARVMQALQTEGWADVNGLHLTKEAFDQIGAVRLDRDMTSFAGDALVVGLSRGTSMPTRLTRLAEHLRSIGARVAGRVVTDDQARSFGQYHYFGARTNKLDTQATMEVGLAEATVSWCLDRQGTAEPSGAPSGKGEA
jgi:CBS domain-containing protein